MTPLRMALCGVGRFAQRRILPVFDACAAVELTATVSTSGKTATHNGTPVPTFRSLEALFDAGAADAVFLTTPNALHAPQTIACLDAGLHVLCEKPMATRAADCAAMIAAARRSGRFLQVAHVLRFSPALALATLWIAEGRIGRVRRAKAHFHYELPPEARVWASDPAIAGGGVLMDVGVHVIDACHLLFGGPITAVRAALTYDRPGGVDLAAACVIRAGDVDCAMDLRRGLPYSSHLEIEGTDGRIVIPGFSVTWDEVTVECRDTHGGVERVSASAASMHRDQLAAFARQARQAPDRLDGAEAAADGLAAIESLYDRAVAT